MVPFAAAPCVAAGVADRAETSAVASQRMTVGNHIEVEKEGHCMVDVQPVEDYLEDQSSLLSVSVPWSYFLSSSCFGRLLC